MISQQLQTSTTIHVYCIWQISIPPRDPRIKPRTKGHADYGVGREKKFRNSIMLAAKDVIKFEYIRKRFVSNNKGLYKRSQLLNKDKQAR